MSQSMQQKNPRRHRLLQEARELNIVGRHKMNTSTLEARIRMARATENAVGSKPSVVAAVLPMTHGVAAIRKAREETLRDDFPVGTVIRWEADGGHTVYHYAAIKAGNGAWYTTAASFNTHVSQNVDFETLVEILARSETTQIEVATTWEPIDR
jgi:hypothetical protein